MAPGALSLRLVAAGLRGCDRDGLQPTAGSELSFGFGPAAETQFRFDVTTIAADDVEWKCLAERGMGRHRGGLAPG